MPLQFGAFCRVIAKMKRTGRAETLWRSMALPRWLPWALLKISVTAQPRHCKRLRPAQQGPSSRNCAISGMTKEGRTQFPGENELKGARFRNGRGRPFACLFAREYSL